MKNTEPWRYDDDYDNEEPWLLVLATAAMALFALVSIIILAMVAA